MVEESMQTLVENLHAAFSTKEDKQMSEREQLIEKRAELQKEKAALVRELRNEKKAHATHQRQDQAPERKRFDRSVVPALCEDRCEI